MSTLLDCGHKADSGSEHEYQGKPAWEFVLLDDGRKVCKACAMLQVLDCGHHPSPHSTFTTGYGVADDGKKECYACCGLKDLAYMREHGRIDLYFSDGKVSNWPDSFSFDTFNITRSEGYGFGRRYPIVTGRFRFEGALWSFRNAGDNQIARCRRLKDPRA